MTDLERLAAAIEAGEFPGYMTPSDVGMPHVDVATLYGAFSGSLDAAKSLHDSVLPGYEYLIGKSNVKVFPYNDTNDVAGSYGMADTPARAWLLAIVRALIAKEGKE